MSARTQAVSLLRAGRGDRLRVLQRSLRDDASRAAYDAVRARSSAASTFGQPGPGPWQGPTGSQGSGKDFDAEFERWWRSRGFGSQVDEEILRERRSAQRRARAEAWEAEKADASANKVARPARRGSCTAPAPPRVPVACVVVWSGRPGIHPADRLAAWQARNDRLHWRTANARAERHARVLSRHWQAYAGLCWQDVLVMGLFVAGTLCAGALVRPVRKPPEPAGS